MDKKITDKIAERIVDLEADVLLQRELVEVLSKIQVSGEEAASLAQRLAISKQQLVFNEKYVDHLKKKYNKK
jgi:hypothetical protein